MDDEGRVFKVVHADGSTWTISDLEKWALDHDEYGLVYCDMDGFYIDEFGYLCVADECGNYAYLGESDDMKIVYTGGGR